LKSLVIDECVQKTTNKQVTCMADVVNEADASVSVIPADTDAKYY